MKSGTHYWFAGALGKYLLDALLATVSFRVLSAKPHQPLTANSGVNKIGLVEIGTLAVNRAN